MHFSTRITRATLLILTSILLNPPTQANAAYYTNVHLRIEGPDTTIFEKTIRTSGHIVTTASGGTHMCDGTNNGANQSPGGTITTAIDDAVVTWDGTWNKVFQDYFITSIAGYAQTQDKFWGLIINYEVVDKGGCQKKVSENDQVLLAFDAFGTTNTFLKASVNPVTVRRGGEVTVTVVNGARNEGIEHAIVLGKSTNTEGKVTIKFEGSLGVYKFKASKDKTIRSNEVTVTVVAAAEATTTTTAPIVYGAGCGCCNE